MTDSDYPWEPPLAGTEVEQFVGALERLRNDLPLEGPTTSPQPGCRPGSAPPR